MSSVFRNRCLYAGAVRWFLVVFILAVLPGCTSIGPTGLPLEVSDIDLPQRCESRVRARHHVNTPVRSRLRIRVILENWSAAVWTR